MLRKNRGGAGPASQGSPLDGVPLLASMSASQRSQLASQLIERNLVAGETAVVEGRDGVGFFFITAGRAGVVVQGEQKRTLGPGDYFGEIAMLSEGHARSASVVAETDLEYFGMTAWQFTSFLQANPAIKQMITATMAERLAET